MFCFRLNKYTSPSADTVYDSAKSGSSSNSGVTFNKPENTYPFTDDEGESVDNIGFNIDGSAPNLRVNT